MPAGKYDLTIERGATLERTFTWKDSSGSPVNLTGYTARMQVRKRANAETALLDLSTANGGIALGGALGTVAVTAAASATATLPDDGGVWALELTSPTGRVTRLLEGKAHVSPEVVR